MMKLNNIEINGVLFTYLIVTILNILAMLSYYFLMRNKHAKRRNYDYNKPEMNEFADIIGYVIRRRYEHRMNYVGFQLVDKILGVASVVYSLLGFLVVAIQTDKMTQYIINFTAVLCVVLALYLIPKSRIAEYDQSAKYLDQQFMTIYCTAISMKNEGKDINFIRQIVLKMTTDAVAKAEEIVISDTL